MLDFCPVQNIRRSPKGFTALIHPQLISSSSSIYILDHGILKTIFLCDGFESSDISHLDLTHPIVTCSTSIMFTSHTKASFRNEEDGRMIKASRSSIQQSHQISVSMKAEGWLGAALLPHGSMAGCPCYPHCTDSPPKATCRPIFLASVLYGSLPRANGIFPPFCSRFQVIHQLRLNRRTRVVYTSPQSSTFLFDHVHGGFQERPHRSHETSSSSYHPV